MLLFIQFLLFYKKYLPQYPIRAVPNVSSSNCLICFCFISACCLLQQKKELSHFLQNRGGGADAHCNTRNNSAKSGDESPVSFGGTLPLQGSRIRFVLGCVIPRAGAVARSRNLGQALFGSPVSEAKSEMLCVRNAKDYCREIQYSAKRKVCPIGCMIPHPGSLWPRDELTQPRIHLLADYCTSFKFNPQ